MPLPERLRAWLDEDRWNFQILTAMMDGVVAGAQGEPLGERALKLGYAARTAQGDAFEAGHEYGKEHRIARPEAGEGPALNSIITLRRPIIDERGETLPAELDVVVIEIYPDGAILISADNEGEEDVSAYVHPGEWYQRPEEVRSRGEAGEGPREEWCVCGHLVADHDFRPGGGGRCTGGSDNGGCLCRLSKTEAEAGEGGER